MKSISSFFDKMRRWSSTQDTRATKRAHVETSAVEEERSILDDDDGIVVSSVQQVGLTANRDLQTLIPSVKHNSNVSFKMLKMICKSNNAHNFAMLLARMIDEDPKCKRYAFIAKNFIGGKMSFAIVA